MADGRQIYGGAASAAVTLSLALILLLAHQQSSETARPPRPPPEVKVKLPPANPVLDFVVLPMPPGPEPAVAADPASAPKPAARPALKPRPDPRSDLQRAAVVPLAPRVEKPAPVAVVPRTPRAAEPRAAVTPVEAPPPSERSPTPAANPTETARLPSEKLMPSTEQMTEGRVLLRLLESGKGPLIEIAWPASPRDRAALYDRLTACHGMRTALMAPNKTLFIDDGGRGAPQEINRDRSSGFMRHPAGDMPAAEHRILDRIRMRHGLGSGMPVRLFPRTIDAALLGGFSAAIGSGYMSAKSVRAHYRVGTGGIVIERISVDGARLAGRIVLPTTAGRSCR